MPDIKLFKIVFSVLSLPLILRKFTILTESLLPSSKTILSCKRFACSKFSVSVYQHPHSFLDVNMITYNHFQALTAVPPPSHCISVIFCLSYRYRGFWCSERALWIFSSVPRPLCTWLFSHFIPVLSFLTVQDFTSSFIFHPFHR